MTEEEAKQKWCPFAQSRSVKTVKMDGTALHETMTVNGEESAKPLCIGKDCMAWRWSTEPNHSLGRTITSIPSTTDGFCGLAGKP